MLILFTFFTFYAEQGKAGNLWFGTTGSVVYRYDGKLFHNYTVKDGLNNNAVWSILEDTSGNIWFGGEERLSSTENEGGIWCYDGTTFKNYTINDGISKNAVFCMLQDRDGNIWLGTRNTGLYQFDGETFTHYSE